MILELATDFVGAGEVAGLTGLTPLVDQPFDLGGGNGRSRVFGASERHHAEHAIEGVERTPNRGGVGGPDTTIVSTTSINNGQWHHVAATRNRTSGEIKLYVDGVLQATATGPLTTLDASAVLRLGSLGTGAGFLAGDIDDVQIYNYPLPPDRVAALATRLSGSPLYS